MEPAQPLQSRNDYRINPTHQRKGEHYDLQYPGSEGKDAGIKTSGGRLL